MVRNSQIFLVHCSTLSKQVLLNNIDLILVLVNIGYNLVQELAQLMHAITQRKHSISQQLSHIVLYLEGLFVLFIVFNTISVRFFKSVEVGCVDLALKVLTL